jgi:hypothetical protein
MSFRAVSEILVHFESFRNIDLYHQGIYFLRCCLYYQKGDKLYYAQPYTIFNSKLPMHSTQAIANSMNNNTGTQAQGQGAAGSQGLNDSMA